MDTLLVWYSVAKFVEYYSVVRLHSPIGYVAPKDKLKGNEATIFQGKNKKLEEARKRRRHKRRLDFR